MAWPQEYFYSGEREHTVWAIRELALAEIATALYIFGPVAIVLVIAKFFLEIQKGSSYEIKSRGGKVIESKEVKNSSYYTYYY